MSPPRWQRPLVILLVILGGSLPVALYAGLMRAVPTLTAREAIELLRGPGERAILVDVREKGAFAARHLALAENWPLEEIAALTSPDQVPAQTQNRTLLLLCDVGISSLEATRRLQALGLDDVHNVRGGIQEWIGAWEGPCQDPLCEFVASSGERGDLAFRSMARYEQWAEVFAGVGVKAIYTVLSAGLAVALILSRVKAPDLRAVQWTLIFFFVGETFCVLHSASYLVLREEVYLFEYLHGYGMVLAFAFTTYAVIEGVDVRGFKLSNPGKKCAALELCGPCIKYETVPCGARRAFLLLLPLLIISAGIPLVVPLSSVSYNTSIAGLSYNFAYLAVYQIYDLKFNAGLAVALFALSFTALWIRKDIPASATAKLLFSAGMGAFGFSMFRLLFSTAYQNDLVWFDFWEEVTELLYIIAIGCVLWIFRRRLFSGDSPIARLFASWAGMAGETRA